MSDTPRTDEAQFGTGRVSVDFARQLERELNAINVEIEEKRKDIVYLATEKAKLEDRIKRLDALVTDPSALWINWLRGDVTLPVGIGEVRQYQDRIKRLEEELMDTKNKHAVLVADVVLNEDRAERIKRLEEAGDYLCAAAAFMGWHDKIETWNKAKDAK